MRNEIARLTSEVELLQARTEDYDRLLAAANVEVERLNGILEQIYGSRTWRLHLFLDRLRGRR
jgi:hypothetical protein